MRETGVELCVGDSVLINNHVVTVIDIAGDQITFRIDQSDDFPATADSELLACGRLPPR